MKRNKKLHLGLKEGETGLVPILELLDLNPPVRRFVGITVQRLEEDGKERFVFTKKPEGDIVKYHPHYVRAVKEGTLEPLDKDSALLCNVELPE